MAPLTTAATFASGKFFLNLFSISSGIETVTLCIPFASSNYVNASKYVKIFKSFAGGGPSEAIGDPVIVSKGEGAYALTAVNGDLIGVINGQELRASLTKAWHHVALAYNGSNQMLYVYGRVANSTTLIIRGVQVG